MPNYRRAFVPGGTWFFTVNFLERHNNNLLAQEVDLLREIVRRARAKYSFHIDAWVVLLDHMHAVCTLSPGDANFSLRWRLIKQVFPVPCQRRNDDQLYVVRQGNVVYGSAISGNISFVMRVIIGGIWITCTLIHLSMGVLRVCVIGPTQVFTSVLQMVYIRLIGVEIPPLRLQVIRFFSCVRLRHANRTYGLNIKNEKK